MPQPSSLRAGLARQSPVIGGIGALCLIFLALVVAPAPFERMRLAFFDALQRSSPWTDDHAAVTVVHIDEQSLVRFGQWPWPRNVLARLVDRLRQLGAASIAFDAVFAEPDRSSPGRIAADLPATVRDRLGNDAGLLPDYDRDFAATLAKGGVTLGFGLLTVDNQTRVEPKAALAVIDGDPAEVLPQFAGAVTNLPALDAAAAGLGGFTIAAGRDEIVRRMPMLTMVAGRLVPSLSLEALRVATGEDTLRVRFERSAADAPVTGVTVRLGDVDIPLDRDGSLLLHHRGPRGTDPIPAVAVLEQADRNLRDRIAGRLVFIGTSAVGLGDLRPTPLNPFEPGVNLHANAAEQMLAGHFLDRPATSAGIEAVAAATSGLVVLAVLQFFGLGAAALLTLALVAALVGGAIIAFRDSGLLFDPTLAVLTTVVVFVVASLARHFLAERRGAALARAFAQYLSPDLARRLARNPDEVRLGGEERQMTFVFTDLEGFTSLTESIPPERLVTVLNGYLDGLSRIAMDHGGTIDKIVGDALHVMFNAPLDQPDHAERAIRAALAMRRFGEDYANAQRDAGLAFGITRIGVNTGPAIVGNFGGTLRFDYTAHGDAINTAARLEAANKQLGSKILISRATRDAAPGFPVRPLGEIALRGKSAAIEVFEPYETAEAAAAQMSPLLARTSST